MLENHITRDPLPDPAGLLHLEKHYVDYGVLHYTTGTIDNTGFGEFLSLTRQAAQSAPQKSKKI